MGRLLPMLRKSFIVSVFISYMSLTCFPISVMFVCSLFLLVGVASHWYILLLDRVIYVCFMCQIFVNIYFGVFCCVCSLNQFSVYSGCLLLGTLISTALLVFVFIVILYPTLQSWMLLIALQRFVVMMFVLTGVMFSALSHTYKTNFVSSVLGMSNVYMLKSLRDNIDPCGAPASILLSVKLLLSFQKLKQLSSSLVIT